MKTTLELPDELMRAVKIRAANENKRLKEVVADAIRRGLEEQPRRLSKIRHRIKLPLLQGGHPAAPGEELTPERVAQILLDQEVEWHRQANGESV